MPDQLTPYQQVASAYAEWDWSPLPLPAKEKFPPPSGYTGARGETVTPEQAAVWAAPRARAKAGNLNYPPSNVAIRLPRNVIGVDLDAYGEKAGQATLDKAEEEWGQLPATWMATSKRNGSGIRLFRVPEGLSWPESLRVFGGGVDLIRWDHRYVVAPPSVHPSGDTYRWVKPDGTDAEVDDGGLEFPSIDELAELPQAWIEGLTGGQSWQDRPTADLDAEEVQEWIEARPNGEPCAPMAKTLNKWLLAIRTAGDDGGAHDVARDGAWALIGDASEGHAGLASALDRLLKAFEVAVKDRRPDYAKEWQRIITRGVQKVAAEGEPVEEDLCAVLETGKVTPRSSKASAYDFTRDDIGNAMRLQVAFGYEARWSLVHNSWMVYREGRWQEDKTGEVDRIAIKMVRDMMSEAERIEEPKERAAFIKFIRASSNAGKLRAMKDVARTLKGITAPAGTFDMREDLLACPNGTVELGDRVEVKPSILEHYNTMSTGTELDLAARSGVWDGFLQRFQPDPEIREWLQLLVGYSLLGNNQRRIMVVCLGPSSTGKSTFGAALRAALGDYAAQTGMTILRDNQDEKPRPDLVRVLHKRLVTLEEASSSWYLHADQIKRITGGVPITARLLQANEYTNSEPGFTPWLITNNPPTIEGADRALRRRIMVTPWDVVIPEGQEDDRFMARLRSPEVRAAILAWALMGWQRYREAPDRLTYAPAGADKATRRFWREVSEFDEFLWDVCEFGSPDEYCVTSSDLYTVYERWCDTNGTPARDRLTQTKMGHRLRGNFTKVSGRTLPGYEGTYTKAWSGLRLTANARKLVK